jgi:hypothetical protein
VMSVGCFADQMPSGLRSGAYAGSRNTRSHGWREIRVCDPPSRRGTAAVMRACAAADRYDALTARAGVDDGCGHGRPATRRVILTFARSLAT